MKDELRFRQIHLDFHTSELIDQVGSDFDGDEFAQTLFNADVNSVTCFARCHHGYLYYESEKFPERIHPGLKVKGMLEKQMAACKEKGIKTPVYITVQWDYYTANKNPQWLMRDEKGAPMGQEPLKAGFYALLCVNTEYIDFLKEQTLEVVEKLKPDGIFFDIVQTKPCCCPSCIKTMEEKGFNPLSQEDRYSHYKLVLKKFKEEMSELVKSVIPDASVFYNSGHIAYETKETKDSYTHFELESLPGGEWGYMHFPITMRYARKLDKDCLGHTGKFHTTWGDFHSFKNKEALEYECLRMVALNAKCLIGDQLEPSGKLSPHVYDLIGSAYSKVKKIEPWCEHAVPITEIGVLSPDEFSGSGLDALPEAMTGVARMLEQCSYQFDFIDSQMEFDEYKLIILPDTIPVNETLAEKLKNYIKNGGRILASFESGMDDKGEKFTLSDLGVKVKKITVDDESNSVRGRFTERADFSDYVKPEGRIGEGLHFTEYVMYTKGVEVKPLEQAKSEIKSIEPYFNRSYKHFCSHRQAPSSGESGYDAVVSTDNTIYFAHPVFSIYEKLSPRWVKTMVNNAIETLIGDKIISHDGPSCVTTAINRQEKKSRYALHILSFIPEAKSASLDIIEDIIPLHDLNFELNLPDNVKSLKTISGGNIKNIEIKDKNVKFNIPVLKGAMLIEIIYEK